MSECYIELMGIPLSDLEIIIKERQYKHLVHLILGSCLNGKDFKTLSQLCSRLYFEINDESVKAACLRGMGYLAMNFKKANHKVAKKMLADGLDSTSVFVRSAANDARDDLEHFVLSFKYNG